VANEGRFALFVPGDEVEKALAALRSVEVSSGSALVGRVEALEGSETPRVLMRTPLGGYRLLDMLSGEQLPRIC